MVKASKASRISLPLLAALTLVACGQPAEEKATYEAGVTDESGGQLVVTEQTPAVEVELPQVRMTPVRPGETPRAGATSSPATQASPAAAAAPPAD